jgi:phosphoribosylanthranilate isomerase
MATKVKICGITNFEDALAAVNAGADALGFVFVPASPRALAFEDARRIIRRIPLYVTRIGVFVNPAEDTVNRALEQTGIDTLQFHGNETPEFCAQFSPLKVIKAFRIAGPETLNDLPFYKTNAWLLDSFVPGQPGGTGATFSWPLAVQAKEHGVPILLAGGLTARNVARAISEVRPFGVDVSSGVESSPGKKDHGLLGAFIAAAKGFDATRAEAAPARTSRTRPGR